MWPVSSAGSIPMRRRALSTVTTEPDHSAPQDGDGKIELSKVYDRETHVIDVDLVDIEVRDSAGNLVPNAIIQASSGTQYLATPTPGDANGDGLVDIDDFQIVIGSWGPCQDPPASCPADFDDDSIVGINDFLIVLGNWGM